jgi:hypothetical protein
MTFGVWLYKLVYLATAIVDMLGHAHGFSNKRDFSYSEAQVGLSSGDMTTGVYLISDRPNGSGDEISTGR